MHTYTHARIHTYFQEIRIPLLCKISITLSSELHTHTCIHTHMHAYIHIFKKSGFLSSAKSESRYHLNCIFVMKLQPAPCMPGRTLARLHQRLGFLCVFMLVTYTCICVCVCVCVCVCIYIYIYIYILFPCKCILHALNVCKHSACLGEH